MDQVRFLSHRAGTIRRMKTWCTSCGARSDGSLCATCRLSLTPGTARLASSGLLVSSGLAHAGVARRLVHRLKYEGDRRAARILGEAMARIAPRDVAGWVPVPRAGLRTLRYGVDPAVELSQVLQAATGTPVIRALRSGPWWASHSKGELAVLAGATFHSRASSGDPRWVLVDDVATTGATLESARQALGGIVSRALVATTPRGTVSRLMPTTDTTL